MASVSAKRINLIVNDSLSFSCSFLEFFMFFPKTSALSLGKWVPITIVPLKFTLPFYWFVIVELKALSESSWQKIGSCQDLGTKFS